MDKDQPQRMKIHTFPIGATEETLAGVEVEPIQASRISDQHLCPPESAYRASE